MGRGRAKAKQIKVARKLKYNSAPSTDLSALERELHSSSGGLLPHSAAEPEPDEDEEDDTYSSYASDEDEGDYDAWAAGGER